MAGGRSAELFEFSALFDIVTRIRSPSNKFCLDKLSSFVETAPTLCYFKELYD